MSLHQLSASAAIGAIFALLATILLPMHAGGGHGGWIAAGFLVAGVALAIASVGLGRQVTMNDRDGFRSLATLGAAGFVVSGAGLLADVVWHPIVTSEVVAVMAVGLWWAAVWWRSKGHARLAGFSLVCAVLVAVALVTQFTWRSVPPGVVPARFAYVLWGPWGLWLAAALRSSTRSS